MTEEGTTGGSLSAPAEDPVSDAPSADDSADAPAYADWRAAAEAVESGELSGEGFEPAGSGTADDPYAVSTPEAFAWWALLHAETHARLEADLDLTERAGEPLAWPGDATLSGELDGAGHAVAFATDGAGLFAEVAATGAVRWLTLGRTAAQAQAAGDAGKPAAEVASKGALAGSVAGSSKGEIQGVVSLAPVGFSADADAGAERCAGGVVAANDGAIADCANLAPVSNDATAGDSAAGGIAARGAGTVATSYSAGDVKAAQNAAYITTLLDAEGDYASVVDDATCYLAPGEGAAYEGVSEAGADRPGALTASELQSAAARLNAGREGTAAAWSAGDDATNGFPAPSEPADPGAQPAGDDAAPEAADAETDAAPMLLSAEATADAPASRATLAGLYSTWLDVGKAVDTGEIPDQKPAEGSVVLPSSSASGTASNAYVIKTPEQLAWFAYMSNTNAGFTGKTAQLAADIDLSGLKYTGKEAEGVGENYANCLPWTPIGDGATARPFQGRFDGAGYQIGNVRMEANGDGQGFFGALTGSAVVERVGLPSGCLRLSSANSSDIGTLAGFVASTATVRNCYSLVDVTGDEGITYFSATGFAGTAEGALENCYYAGTLRADVGDAFSFATGTATRLYYDGTKSPDANTGAADPVESSVLKDAAKAAELTSTYATWRTDWGNQNDGYVTIARAGEPVASPSTWENVGLELDKIENRGLLPAQETVTLGDGSQRTAFVIENAEQLAWFAYKVNTLPDFGSQSAQLAADIDLSGLDYTGKGAEGVGEGYANCLPWVPIGALSGSTRRTFSGVFDGAGFQIKNLRVNATGQGFGFVGFGVDCKVQRVGLASGTLDVRNSGAVYVGTLAGSLEGNATASNCYSRVDVVGVSPSNSSAGGLVGYTYGNATVRSSYYAGSVGAMVNDAFLGYRGGPSPVQCFFDKEKTDRLASSSANGLSTVEFKDASMVSRLTTDGATWRTDWLGQNGGYPVIARDGQPVAAPASWDAVGEAMKNRVPGMPELPSEQTVLLGRDGEKAKAYVIERPEQLAWYAYTLAHMGASGEYAPHAKNVVLAADLDMGGLSYAGASEPGENFANCLEWMPIGPTSAQAYRGFFDGAGHTVTNLRIVRKSGAAAGFFGYVAGGKIQRLGLASGSISGAGDTVAGSLAGNVASGEVASCFSRVDVAASAAAGVGGLVGSFASGYLTGAYYAGSIPRGVDAVPVYYAGSPSVAYAFYDSDKGSGSGTAVPHVAGVPSATLKTWGAAYELNGRSAEAPAPFVPDAAGGNDGYPVINAGSEPCSASTWADVGRWVEDFAPDEGRTGAGTAGDPFKLTTTAGLAWWAYRVNGGSFQSSCAKLELTGYGRMEGSQYTGIYSNTENYGESLPWIPVEGFTGEFDGNGEALTSLRIQDGDDRGFFKELLGTVKNLELEGFLSGNRIGGFAGTMQGTKAKAVNCTSSMVLQTNIEEATIPASAQGGIAFSLYDGATIDSCGNRSSRSYAGTNAQEPSDAGYVGGIAGIVGSGCTVRNCFNDFNTAYEIMGYQAYVGGIAGTSAGTVENCYNKTPLKKTGSKGAIGDIVGLDNGVVKNCYSSSSDVYTPGDSTNADGSVKLKHLPDAQMKGKGFAINLNGNTSGAGTAWTTASNGLALAFGEMPVVTWEDIGQAVANNEGAFGAQKPTGTGASEAAALQLGSAEQLAYAQYMATRRSDETAPGGITWQKAFYKLTGDIDLSATYGGAGGTEWKPFNTTVPLMGTFDGAGFTIRNLKGGVFISQASGATVKGVNLASSEVTVAPLMLMATNASVIERCSAAADVAVRATFADVSGLIAIVEDSTVRDCWTRASVEGTTGIGGLIGSMSGGTVKNCYSAPASLTGTAACGALFGKITGTAPSVSNCYYPQSLSAVGSGTVTGATALAPSRMTTPLLAFDLNAARTGADAPWTWNLLENGGYPVFGVPPIDVDAGTWGGIGALQNEDELRRTVAEIAADGYGSAGAVQTSAPATAALSGSGTTADPYVVRTPEALAWFACKVNDGTLDAAHQNVSLGANIDLAGLSYTGAAEIGTNHANCLEWTPIGTFAGYDESSGDLSAGSVPFEGSFQGGAHAIKNLRLKGKADRGTGFFGLLESGRVKRVTFASGTMDIASTGAGMSAGTLAAASGGDAVVKDCAMLVDVAGLAPAGTKCAAVIGLSLLDESLQNSYYAGGIADASIEVIANLAPSSSLGAEPFFYLNADNPATNFPEATRVTSDQLKTWGAAHSLNAAENVADGKVWRKAKGASENNGFPVLLTDEEIAAGVHMDAAASWAEVGEWWDMIGNGATGAGTTASPFEIVTPEQLAWLAYKVTNGSLAAANQNAKLTKAIDLSGNKYTGKSGTGTNFDACLRWVPIGIDGTDSSAHRYTGAFEGQGFGVQNMRVEQGNVGDGGLFGVLGASASVANTGVDSGYSTGSAGHMGGTIGYVRGTNVKVTGCWNKAQVVSSTYNVGGVVGTTNEASGTVISKCWNTGSVTQTGGDSAGGVVGKVHSGGNTITDCYNTGAITAKTYGGGIVGSTGGGSYTIANCYSAGKVTGGTSGSLVGNSGLNPANSFYATDAGSATGVTKGTGLTSAQLKTWAVAYALNGGDGTKMPADLKTWRMAASASDNGGFPVLVGAKATGDVAHLQNATDWSDVGEWVQFTGAKKPSGTGAAASPFQIGTREALAWFAYMANEHGSENTPSGGVKWSAASAKLTADINMQAAYGGSDTKWVPLGNGDLVSGALTATFNGTLDGDGHTVSNMVTDSACRAAGLVGTLQGTVKGVNVASSALASVNGSGGVVGMAGQGAVIERCSAAKDVTVSSTRYSGGLVGLMYRTASAKDCWTRATVAAGSTSGGFVGSLEGDSALSGCYAAAASVAGSSKKGSFTAHEGVVDGLIERCYFQKASGLAAVQTGSAAKFAERTALQMASPVTAFQLNNGRADNVWTQSAVANDGYPTLGSAAVTLSGWADVGAAQDEGALRRTVAVIDPDGYGTAGAVQASAPATAALTGDGSSATPYVIRTPEALAWFAYMTNSDPSGFGAKHVQLGASIDLTGAGYGGTSAAPLQWASIMANGAGHGQLTGNYSGTFDGQGNTVAHMYQHEASAAAKSGWGLIAFVSGGTVKGTVLEDVDIDVTAASYTSGGRYVTVGGIASQLTADAKVQGCAIRSGTIKAASNEEMTGGIAGDVHQGGGTIENCSVRANVGENASKKYGGGIMGRTNNAATVKNSYFAGKASHPVCYNEQAASSYASVFYDSTVYGSTASAKTGVTALSTAQMQSWGAAYALNDGDGAKELSSLTTWRKAADASDNGGYPVLIRTGDSVASMQAASTWGQVGEWVSITGNAFKPATGAGTAASPYEIAKPEQLAWFSYQVAGGLATANHNIKITADLDLLGAAYTGKTGTAAADSLTWSPIGRNEANKKFSGTIDGSGRTIDHLYIDNAAADYIGLVGWADAVSIDRLGIGADSAVAGDDSVGAFVGACKAAANACKITNCWNRAQVTGRVYAAAFLGDDAGSYPTGSNAVVIENCYNAGKATFAYSTGGTLTNCYADTEQFANAADGESRTGAVVGVTSAQMKSWGAGYQLNGGDGAKELSSLTTWRKASGDSENGGYPVLVKDGAAGDAAHMQPASDWSDVGLWVDAFATGRKPVMQPAPDSWGTGVPAYPIGSAEQLAWLACKVNDGTLPDAASQHAFLTAGFDLSGGAFSGGSKLKWVSIAKNGKHGTNAGGYAGVFDGAGNAVSGLYQREAQAAAGSSWGLFAFVTGGTVRNVAVDGADIDVSAVSYTSSGRYVTVGAVAGQLAGGGKVQGCAVRSGSVKALSNVPMTGGIVGDVHGDGGTIEDCYSRATVGENAAYKYGAGILGRANSPATVKDSYFSGIAKDPVCYNPAQLTCENVLYDKDALGSTSAARAGVTAVTSGQLKSWGAAYQLNGGDGTQARNPTALTTWRKAADASDNGGYPVLVAPGATGDAAHMQPASDWSDVGLWMDAFATGRKPASKEISWRDGTKSNGYEIASAEQLAWLAYRVNGNAAPAEQNAALTSDIDLSGYAYTGSDPAAGAGDGHARCLRWVPAGTSTLGASVDGTFRGRFDGRGFQVGNLHLVARTGSGVEGLFGHASSGSVIERVGISSGTLDATGSGNNSYVATLVGWMEGGSVADCYSVADVVGATGAGGLTGYLDGGTFANCYYGGNLGRFWGMCESGKPNDRLKNCMLVGSQRNDYDNEDVLASSLRGLTADQLKSWGAAYQLNGPVGADGAQRVLGDLRTWRVAADSAENGGFPVLVKPGDVVAGMTPAHDWADVGLWVDVFAPDRKPGEVDAPASWGAAAGTKAYSVDAPEQLAWLAYKVNSDNAGYGSKNAVLSGGIDLFGGTYTGKSLDEAADLNSELGAKALRWVPMGRTDDYKGTFDGQGMRVRHLYSPAEASKAGLVGALAGTVRDVAVEASSVSAKGGSNDAAGAVVASIMGTATIERCSAGKDVSVSAGKAGGIVGYISSGGKALDCASRATVTGSQAGGIMGYAFNATIKSSYFAGSAAGAMVGMDEGGSTYSDNYYQDGSATGASQIAGSATKLSAAEMTAGSGSSLAGRLNGARLGKDAPWRADSKNVNDGYPVLVLAADIMADWAEVGAAQSEDELRLTAAEIDPDGFGTSGAVEATAPAVAALSGTGAADDEFVIRTPEAFAWFACKVNDGTLAAANQNARLGASIDLSGLAYTGAENVGGDTFANCLAWVPIGGVKAGGGADNSMGTADNPYRGSFDGQGCEVSNMRVQERPFKSGLFGYAYSGATIADVHVVSGYVHGIDRVGGVVGQTVGAVTVEDCSNAATVLSEKSVGGYSGIACNAGGVVGCVLVQGGLTVRGCSNTGAVTSGREAGGVLGEGNSVSAVVENSFNTGAVTSTANAGGICGGGATSGSNNATLAIRNCYNAGKVSGSGGSIVGPTGATVTNSYYANDIGSVANATRGTAVTSDQLKSWGAAYQLNGGDGAKALGDLNTWRKAADGENGGYPVLVAPGAIGDAAHMQPASDWSDVGAWVDAFATGRKPDEAPAPDSWGTGTPVYAIGSAEQLAWFAYKVNQGEANGGLAAAEQNAALTQDVDLSGYAYTGKTEGAPGASFENCLEWVPMGVTYGAAFMGRFDGRGYAVGNLHLVCNALDDYVGFFGSTESSVIERTALVSGALDVQKGDSDSVATFVALPAGEIRDCYSLVDVVGPESTVNTIGGFVGDGLSSDGSGPVRFVSCYYGGNHGKFYGWWEVGDPMDAISNSYLLGSQDRPSGDPWPDGTLTGLTADQLKSWGAAYQLNGGDGAKALSSLTTWRKAADASENDGYPVLVRTGDSVAGMQPASDWSDVGAWVDAFAIGRKPDEAPAPDSWGADAGKPVYAIATPEQLAWLAYKVTADNAAFGSKSAVLAAPVDLAGGAYTGRTVAAGAYEDCLEWSPIGTHTYKTGVNAAFSGRFDGAGQSVDNLRIVADGTQSSGLFGWESGATIERVALSSGLVDFSDGSYCGSIAGLAQGGELRDSYSMLALTGSGKDENGGLIGQEEYLLRRNLYFAGERRSGLADGVSALVGYCYIEVRGNENCFYIDGGQAGRFDDVTYETYPLTGVEKLTPTELRSWRTAWRLNGKSYVGKPVSGGAVASTTWTDNPQKADGSWTYGNEGYPVFGDLKLGKLAVTVDPNDVLKPAAAGSDEPAKKVAGAITTPILVAHPLSGPVELLEAPAAPAGVTLSAASDVDAGFSTWGTTSANAKVALVAGATSLTASTYAGTVLSPTGLASVEVHAAAAYDAADARTARLVVMDASGGYEIAVTLKAVTSKTLDVTAPVESGASFELAPDGKLHEGVMAKEASVFKVNGFVPVAGSVSAVSPLAVGSEVAYPDGSKAEVSAALSPAASKLAASNGPITDAGRVRLFAGKTDGSDPALTPLALSLYYDPSKNTVPLAFGVPGSSQAAWKWGMDYTGTYLEPDGVFGFSMGYAFGLPAADVPAAQLSEKA